MVKCAGKKEMPFVVELYKKIMEIVTVTLNIHAIHAKEWKLIMSDMKGFDSLKNSYNFKMSH